MFFDLPFYIGASAIVGVSLLEKLATEYGFPYLAGAIKLGLTVSAFAGITYFIEAVLI